MEPQNRSVSKNYGVSRLFKQKGQNEIIFLETPMRVPFEMGEMKNWIEKAKFEKVTENIGSDILSRNILKDLKGLGKKLVYSKEKQLFIALDIMELFSLSYITPKPIVKILKKIEAEKGRMHRKSDQKGVKLMDELRQRILAKWTYAAFGYFYEKLPNNSKPEFHLNIDENGEPKNGHKHNSLNFDKSNGTFDVQIRTAQKVVKKKENKKFGENSAAIVTVLGDALASPHFYNGNGASTGE
jgi:hypothetical protein